MTSDEKSARNRAHHANISRYHRLLKTKLSQAERRFIKMRLAEEQSALQGVAASQLLSTASDRGIAIPGAFDVPPLPRDSLLI